jgi:hypothetical protein
VILLRYLFQGAGGVALKRWRTSIPNLRSWFFPSQAQIIAGEGDKSTELCKDIFAKIKK